MSYPVSDIFLIQHNVHNVFWVKIYSFGLTFIWMLYSLFSVEVIHFQSKLILLSRIQLSKILLVL